MAATEALAPALPEHIDRKTLRILRTACERDLRLATAESCTGGLLASLLTDVPGCSHAFERGFVVYTDEAKQALLSVSAKVLDTDGPVSEAAARAMADGALANSQAQIAVSITGFTEKPPGGEGEAGLVHFACARHGTATLHRCEHFGDIGRAEIRLRCLEVALDLIEAQLG